MSSLVLINSVKLRDFGQARAAASQRLASPVRWRTRPVTHSWQLAGGDGGVGNQLAATAEWEPPVTAGVELTAAEGVEPPVKWQRGLRARGRATAPYLTR